MSSRSLVALLVGCLVFQFSPVAKAEDAKRIAVVNVSRVFSAYQKVKDVQDKMEKLFSAERNAIEKDGVELKKVEDKLRLDPRDPKTNIAFFREVQQFELAKMELDMRFRKLAEEVEKKRKDEMKDVLNKIKATIRAVGTADNYDLVLRAPEFDDEFDPSKAKDDKDKTSEPQSAAELVRKFRENPVLYFSQGVDITQKVIDKLNDDYKKQTP